LKWRLRKYLRHLPITEGALAAILKALEKQDLCRHNQGSLQPKNPAQIKFRCIVIATYD